MEELSKLLLEERAHSEQFKVNFIHLKAEYDKYFAIMNLLLSKCAF